MGLELLNHMYYNVLQKGGYNMSFYTYLIEKGYTHEKATNACIYVENEIELDEITEQLYWNWFNKEFIKE